MRLTVQGISSIGVFMRFGERMLFNDNEWSVFHDAFSLLYQNSCHLAHVRSNRDIFQYSLLVVSCINIFYNI